MGCRAQLTGPAEALFIGALHHKKGNRTMKFSAPTKLVCIVSAALGVLGLLFQLNIFTGSPELAFWPAFVGLVLVLASAYTAKF